MGITFETGNYLARLVLDAKIGGSLLSLGRQQVLMDSWDLVRMLCQNGLAQEEEGQIFFSTPELRDLVLLTNQVHTHHKWREDKGFCITDDHFFQSLGFQQKKVVDVSDYERPDYIHDLNMPGLRQSVGGEYDFVADIGTMEHVFHLPNVLENIFNTVRVGGYVCHMNPANNALNHGFFQLCPDFYFDYYASNHWEIVRAHLVKWSLRNWDDKPYELIDMDPEKLRSGALNFNALSGGDDAYNIFFCARKTEKSTCSIVPQQNFYVKTWNEAQAMQQLLKTLQQQGNGGEPGPAARLP